MALLTVHPTRLDERIASEVVAHTDRRIERVAGTLTWGADEHVLLALAAVGWALTRNAPTAERRLGNHFLACSLTAAGLPHVMKLFIDQERPDPLTVRGHFRGIPLSGKANDAFPSGHALHVGALASAATLLPPKVRDTIWFAGTVLATTRVILLAHWLTDVVAGLAIGAILERSLRKVTRAGEKRRKQSGAR